MFPLLFALFFIVGQFLLVLAIIAGGRRLNQKSTRILNGLCAQCGYDMRGSTDTCPECGTPKYRYER